MEKIVISLLLIFSCGCATAETLKSRTPSSEDGDLNVQIGTLVSYQNGILKIEMDTCGGQVSPVVTFKPIEEIEDTRTIDGTYRAVITRSKSLSPQTTCPFVGPTRFELDLKKLLKEWANSATGTRIAKAIFEKAGTVEIVVPNLSVQIDYHSRAQ